MSSFKLRAHHGLCIRFFEGKGYSDSFVRNMEDVIHSLQQNPEITLVAQTDKICTSCPHNQKGVCESAEKVNAYDQKVLQLCHLSAGSTMNWLSFQNQIQQNIILPGRLKEVCFDCQWQSLCMSSSS